MIPVHLFLVLKKNCFKILDILIFCETSSLNTPSVQITFQTIFNRNRLFKQHDDDDDPILYHCMDAVIQWFYFKYVVFLIAVSKFSIKFPINCHKLWYGMVYCIMITN